MKKRQFICGGMLLCVLALAACGSGREGQEEADTETAEARAADGAEDDVSADKTAEDLAEPAAETEEDVRPSETAFTDAIIEETTLYDAGGVIVTATGFDAGAEYGPEIAVRVENGSADTIDVTAEDVAVNGYLLDPGLLYVVAAPGGTVESTITLYDFMLDDCGIDTVATISLSIVVSDDATYEEIGVGDRITLTTSVAENFTQPVDDSGEVLYEVDGVRVISQGLTDEGIWDGALLLYAQNDGDRYIGVTCGDVTVNGCSEEDVSFWLDLLPDTRAVTGMDLTALADQTIDQIDEVKELSFTLQIIDQEEGKMLDESDPVTLTFD